MAVVVELVRVVVVFQLLCLTFGFPPFFPLLVQIVSRPRESTPASGRDVFGGALSRFDSDIYGCLGQHRRRKGFHSEIIMLSRAQMATSFDLAALFWKVAVTTYQFLSVYWAGWWP
jgi:hypothetical protein